MAIQIQILCITQRIGIRIIKINVTPRRKVGDTYGGQIAAKEERIRADGGHAGGDGDRLQAAARVERMIADGGQLAVLTKGHRLQAVAIVERLLADGKQGRQLIVVEVEAFNEGSDKIAAKMIFTGVPTQG